MPPEDNALLDAITAGLNETSGASNESANTSASDEDESGAAGSALPGEGDNAADSADVSNDGDAPEDTDADESAGDESGDDEGEGADADGAIDPATGKPVAKAGDKAAKGPVEPAKSRDAVNDPIDRRLKKDTKERMESLIGTVKTVTQERDTIKRDFEDLMTPIEQSRATAQQYGEALDYLRIVNSGDTTAIKTQVIPKLQAELRALALMIGEPVPGVDLLSEHQDLQIEVQQGKISRGRAEELAAARGRTALHTQAQSHHRTATQQQQAQQQAVNSGVAELNSLGDQLKTSDPDYKYKSAAIAASMKASLPRIDPRQWAQVWKQAYDAVPAPVRRVAVPPKPANQPLRASNPAGGAGRAPKSVDEAIGAIDFSKI